MHEIKGIARVKFFPGKRDEWKRGTEQAMEIVRTRDTGTLQYEIVFNADASETIVFDRNLEEPDGQPNPGCSRRGQRWRISGTGGELYVPAAD